MAFNLYTLKPRTVTVTDASGALSDANIGPTIGAKERLLIYELTVTCHNATSNNPSVRIGFGASAVPSASASGADGVLFEHQGMTAGTTSVGLDGMGAAGEEIRATVDDPTSGGVTISFLYQSILD